MKREAPEPVAYRVRTFARLIEASDSGVRELIAKGELRACKVGGLLRIRVKGQNVCLARRVAGVRFGLFECRLSGCSRCR